MSVYYFGLLAPFRNASFEVITEGVRTLGYLLKDFTDDILLRVLIGLCEYDSQLKCVNVHADVFKRFNDEVLTTL